jgi:hypothetical protein
MATTIVERFDVEVEKQTREVFDTLNEKDKRRFAAIQAKQLGHSGMKYISEILGISVSTIGRGIAERELLPEDPAKGPNPTARCWSKKSNAGFGN